MNRLLPLEGRIAAVTGGAQGIGAGICTGLIDAGADVAIVDLQAEKARELADALSRPGRRAHAICADISTEKGCRDAVARVVGAIGGLDILVNNAAPRRMPETVNALSDAAWGDHEQIVLQAPVRLTEAALEYLSRTGCGAVVNISSVTSTAIGIGACSWPYHVSKSGLDQLTKWLAVRLGPQGVRVNAIAPGLIDRETTPRASDRPTFRPLADAVIPLRRAGRASDIAEAVIFLCSDQSSYVTGQVLTIDGGLELNEVWDASLRVYHRVQAVTARETPQAK